MKTIEEVLYRVPNTKAEDWHQHSNGSGWVYYSASVADSAYVGPDALVLGNARVSGNAWVSGNAQVYGNAWVFGDAWVFGAAWETSPLYIQGSRHSVTNCAHGSIAIGCQVHTFAEWKAKYKTIGKAAGYTAAQIKEYSHHIAYVIKVGK